LGAAGDSWPDAGTFGSVSADRRGGSWAQLLAGKYGSDQDPNRRVERAEDGSVVEDAVGGLNYAEGGAVVEMLTDDSGDTPKAATAQLAAFLDEYGSFESDQLVTAWAGANAILAGLAGAGDEEQAARFAAGERTGSELAKAAVGVADAAHREAALVADMLDADARRVLLVAGLFVDVEARPDAYGFEVVDGDVCTNGHAGCGSDDRASPDADPTYAFAGYGHFTAATRELIAAVAHDEAVNTWCP
jgi:phospholipase/lecithinase/hemolysin